MGTAPVFFCPFSSPEPFSFFTSTWEEGSVEAGPKAVFITSVTTTMNPKSRLRMLDIIMACTYR